MVSQADTAGTMRLEEKINDSSSVCEGSSVTSQLEGPTVSIGLVTCNGEKYLRESLESLLKQSFEDFEILISDNASTDSTPVICQEFVARDPRVRYQRNASNIGSVGNFNHVFRRTTGRFFMWASDHDLWHPEFLKTAVSTLQREESWVLCYFHSTLIDLEGNIVALQSDDGDTRGLNRRERFHKVLLETRWCDAIYGVMRREALDKTRLFPLSFGPDNILLAELSILGSFAQVPEYFFFRRLNRAPESLAQKERRIKQDQDPAGQASNWRHLFPFLSMLVEFIKVVSRSHVSLPEKITLIAIVAKFYISRFWNRLMRKFGARPVAVGYE